MKIKYIPIIGTISSGKSTFLKAFLGVNMLQTGASTTTKFVCIIKNSFKNCFYHVIPKNKNGIKFIKEGDEITDVEEIKKKIEHINYNLSEKVCSKNDIFYILETPIKNIKNVELLNSCYFMDIPGLNENKATYIEDIFSLITINDILFEIIIFDSTSIGSDNILDILKELEKKNCLKKKNNLYILNKIDLSHNNKEGNIIDAFKNYFYKEFEDEKNKSKIIINLSENYFIPMNSLLFEAETKINSEFYSLLLFELFNCLEYNKNNRLNYSFYEYIQKKNEIIINHKDIKINDYLKLIKENDNKIIKESINKVKLMTSIIKLSPDFDLGLKLKNEDIKIEIQKLYLIQKLDYYILFHSESYKKLNEIIDEIKINDYQPYIIYNENIINKNLFYNDEKKIRIAFIGNIGVGKSTILNCIIGEKLLPTKETQCTYRGVIIRYKDINNYELYRTKLKKLKDFYYFEKNNKHYCRGIENIKSYLRNKNNDKIIEEEDAYIIIYGKLKIFDFIKLNENIINKIEFIDLPGIDNISNSFNKEKFFDKIIKISNCCIFINDPKTIDDKNNIINEYLVKSNNLSFYSKKKLIRTMVFLINKSDTLNKEEKIKISNEFIKKLFKLENILDKNFINFSLISAKNFFEFIDIYS